MLFLFIPAALFTLLASTYLTNPSSRFSIIRRAYVARFKDATLTAINNNAKLHVRQAWYWRWYALASCGLYILSTRYIKSPRSHASTLDGIIADIHKLRFNPRKLLVVSGDHFSALFVRNLGVFYYPLLDDRLDTSAEDWQNRQMVYLQSLAYALGVYAKRPVPTTTIVPTSRYGATCINFYAYPSDTVYGLLHSLTVLLGRAGQNTYGLSIRKRHSLQTQAAADELLNEYRGTLRKLYQHYRATVFDPTTGLISRAVHLSGAKDITRRTCAFYDNVVFWKTTQLAGELGLIPADPAFLEQLKSHILETFWLEDEGYFLEDLSDVGVRRRYYSSDWLFVLAANFLNPHNPAERPYFERSTAYIQAQKIDQPFAIKYQQDTRAGRQFPLVRLAVASYGGDAIWSFWGMEYIKVLLLLHHETRTAAYLTAADYHLNAYETAMRREGGFPETYDSQGRLLQTPLYRSIRQTGWVVGFEQARLIRAHITHRA